jgi:hypothetical protein
VKLADGRVLIFGFGWPTALQQQLWDPATGQFSPAGFMSTTRSQAIGVLLEDGRVLIVGGNVAGNGTATYSTAELYDPAAGTFAPAGPMVGRGWAPTAVRLRDGRVLVLDGISVDNAQAQDSELKTAEVYDPATDTFTKVGDMSIARAPGTVVLLPDGRVLVGGGVFGGAIDVFDPAKGTFKRLPDVPPAQHAAGGQYWPDVIGKLVSLPDGRVLVAGRHCQEVQSLVDGEHGEGWFPTSAAMFDPRTNKFTSIAPMPHCVETATPLREGLVLLTAFWMTAEGSENWAGIYDPISGQVYEADPPPVGRYMDLIGLADGNVLFIGKRDDRPVAEVFG